MKLHQLFCEGHNFQLQNTLRQQFNEDGKIKGKSFDFPAYYAKMFEEYNKILNNNTLDIGDQLVGTLTECIQGPCKLNQKTLVYAKILDSSREYIANFQDIDELTHLNISEGSDEYETLMEFKKNIITLLTSLLEGEIDMDILTKMALGLDFPVMINRMANVFNQFVQDIMGDCDIKDLNLNKLQDKLDSESLDGIVSEAFEIYILMNSITDTI